MIVIQNLLDHDTLEAIRGHLVGGSWVDGKLTATGAAADVKNNLQLEVEPTGKPSPPAKLLLEAMLKNSLLKRYTLVRAIRRPEFARYTEGMAYGAHIDNPIQGSTPPIRADLSCTVFLSDMEDYDGGELAVLTSFGEKRVKLPAGHAVVYDSDMLHQVLPVMRGERLVAVTWIQSFVRDPQLRGILVDLETATSMLNEHAPNSELRHLVSRSRASLLRRVMEF